MRRLAIALLALLPCAPLAAGDARPDATACVRIPTPPGPLSLLPLPDPLRLLVSTHDRRHFERPGELYAYDTAAGLLKRLPRRGEPAGLVLRPGHMDLVRRGKETLLYLVNHDSDSANGRRHSVLVYAVQGDHLDFRKRYRDPLLRSPNHLSVAPDGDLYVTNDRLDGSSVMELLLRKPTGTLVHYREGQGWRVVADGLGYANGVKAEAERVMVVMTFGNAMLTWPRQADGTLGTREQVVSLPALDGLAAGPSPGTWLTVSRGPLLDLLRHRYFATHPSAATVFVVDTATRSFQPFFSDDGHRISAMSSPVLANRALYLGQAFDDFILRCPLRG
ncbi:MAG TPA: hypothetical protein VFV15_05035 [Moraxellaceae bacterium]|nr:hypothetical protein [Moraxellaceae bacterium]